MPTTFKEEGIRLISPLLNIAVITITIR